MLGRDFTKADHFIQEKALELVESEGEDLIVTYDNLFKMYFESIWSVNSIRKRFSTFGERFNCMQDEIQKDLYYQMLFDLISFYNIGNANQLYRSISDEWIVSNIFSLEARRSNNGSLSAFYYIQFFFHALQSHEHSEELWHLMFLNTFQFVPYPFQKSDVILWISKFNDSDNQLKTFYDYAIKVSKDFYKGTYMGRDEFVELMRQESDYFHRLSDEKKDEYLEYMKEVKDIMSECELCVQKQLKYGTVEMEFDGVLGLAI